MRTTMRRRIWRSLQAGSATGPRVFREDLEEINKRKVGVPFRFSDSMIWWILCVMTAVNTDFRFISGFLAGIFPSFGLESAVLFTSERNGATSSSGGILSKS